MIHRLYERRLRRSITTIPGHLCIMITGEELRGAPDQLRRVTEWCIDLGIPRVTYHVSKGDGDGTDELIELIVPLESIVHLRIFRRGELIFEGGEGISVDVAVGTSGREEITDAIRRMADEGIRPDDLSAKMIKEYLLFPYEPDLVIKTGGRHLTDFLIWQSVYAELLFLDVNWQYLRRVDLLRALRDYQKRSRRFGR
ncbi:MAG: undecaprenyl diphosphate synthase family protein [Methanoculleaceae archaeon]